MGDTPSEEFPGWEASGVGTLRLTIVVADVHITLATVTRDAGTGLFLTYIGEPVSANQLGRHDASQERAVRKAEEFLLQKLRNLLLHFVTMWLQNEVIQRFYGASWTFTGAFAARIPGLRRDRQ